MTETPTTTPPAATPAKPKAPRPRKLKGRIGPFLTAVEVFDSGRKRLVDFEADEKGVYVHAARTGVRRFVPWGAIYDKGVQLAANFDAGPRRGGIVRSTNGGN